MPLADIRDLTKKAKAQKVGLGAFNVVLLEHGEAFISAAEQTGLPIVLAISQNAIKYHRGLLAPIGTALLKLAEGSSAEVVVHLDHAEDIELCKAAVELGFNSIMYDGSKLPDKENREITRDITRWCHNKGVSVEAELGEVGGKNGVHDPVARTDPHDARQFVEDTEVDLLAVAVGSSHTMTSRDAQLDNSLIEKIEKEVSVPLVLHGSSGVSDEGMRAAIESGITKINVSTHLNVLYTEQVRKDLESDKKMVDPRKYSKAGNFIVEEEVARLMKLYANL